MNFFKRRTHRPDGTAPAPLCSCGRPLDPVDMDYGFQLPDEIFALAQDELPSRIRGLAKVFVLDQSRGFVRTLLPVRLDHGSVQFGLWLEIPESQARMAIEVWEAPGYVSLEFTGKVANHLPPWGEALLGARATASPSSQNELPVVNGGDAVVQGLLNESWRRSDVVAALPGLRHAH